jgi:hypothetical protein
VTTLANIQAAMRRNMARIIANEVSPEEFRSRAVEIMIGLKRHPDRWAFYRKLASTGHAPRVVVPKGKRVTLAMQHEAIDAFLAGRR